MSIFNKINNHFFIWEIKSTRDFIIFVSLITMVGLIIGSTFSMQSIHAQINNTSQTNSNSGNVQANNSQNSYFTMGGSMSSFISTPASDFVVSGNWTLRVEGGNLSGFNANMTWFPTNVTAPNIQAHGHSFSNFIADPTNEKIVLLGPDNTLGAKQTYSINGVMDVGANQNQTKWPSVPANIKLGGKTITISLDDSKTDGHFNNYPVFGQIAKLEMNQVLSQSAPKQPGTQSQQTNQISEQKDNLKLDIILQFSNKAVIASNEGDDTGVKENLLKLQEYLKESAGNKVMSMPANEIFSE